MSVVDCRNSNETGDAAPRVGGASSPQRYPWVFAAIVVLAAALRLPALDLRPMHADESVQAAKFGTLLERAVYEYDPTEYHGPTLNYFTLLPARVGGAARFADLDETTLRLLPAIFGVLLVAAHILLVPVVGLRPAALAALLAAVSPAMVYYSRYYIHETLLVTFTFGALISICRYMHKPGAGWAVAGGASIGLMAATKETWVIAFGSMAVSLVLCHVSARGRQTGTGGSGRRRMAFHLGVAVISALALACLFYSSFLSHPRGIIDAVAAFTTYLARGGGNSWHVQPFHYYLGLLLFNPSAGAQAWTEAAIVVLALIGLAAVYAGRSAISGDRRALKFFGVYAVLMVVIYASIRYKTPWCVLSLLDGCVVLAGVGGAWLLSVSARRSARLIVGALLLAVVAHLAWLAWAASFRFASDPRNPYVYAHTGSGVFEIMRRVDDLARTHPQGSGMPVEVISSQNLWPLPWYLRRFSNVRWETAPVNDGASAPVILATPDMEGAIRTKLYEWRHPGERELYVPIFEGPVELRPQVQVRGYAAKSLWDQAFVR